MNTSKELKQNEK